MHVESRKQLPNRLPVRMGSEQQTDANNEACGGQLHIGTRVSIVGIETYLPTHQTPVSRSESPSLGLLVHTSSILCVSTRPFSLRGMMVTFCLRYLVLGASLDSKSHDSFVDRAWLLPAQRNCVDLIIAGPWPLYYSRAARGSWAVLQYK